MVNFIDRILHMYMHCKCLCFICLSLKVQMKCLLMFTSVIQKLDKKKATSYIRGVAAKFLEYLLILKDDKSGLDSQHALVTASLNFAEVLVDKAEEDKSKLNI